MHRGETIRKRTAMPAIPLPSSGEGRSGEPDDGEDLPQEQARILAITQTRGFLPSRSEKSGDSLPVLRGYCTPRPRPSLARRPSLRIPFYFGPPIVLNSPPR